MDEETGLRFRGLCGGPCLNLYTLESELELLNKLIDLDYDYIGSATHEQYFYEDYYAYQPDYEEKLYALAKRMTDAGYRWVTGDELQ